MGMNWAHKLEACVFYKATHMRIIRTKVTGIGIRQADLGYRTLGAGLRVCAALQRDGYTYKLAWYREVA